jgi:nucleotide sugar dehydrogenase
MNIGVIGVGRLGICFALLLEKAGHTVLGSDIRKDYVDLLNKKQIITHEPQVAEYLAASNNFCVVSDNKEVIKYADVIYVMVATPSLSNGSYDVSAVWNAVDDLVEVGKEQSLQGKIFVVGCTTNPGDCQKIQDKVKYLGIDVLYNPEFIAQGSIIRDLQRADMVLIGGENQDAINKFSKLYADIQTTELKINSMSLTAAEITKIAINCFCTTKISIANWIGQVLVKSGLEHDIKQVTKAMGDDTRIGNKYLNFGFGYGGPCLPRDNRALAHYSKSLGIEFNLGFTVDDINKEHSNFLRDYFIQKNVDKLPFYMPYITYKPNSDIMEESQQFKLCVHLLEMGYTVYVEENDMIPQKYKNSLLENKTFKFVKIEELNEHEVFKVNI